MTLRHLLPLVIAASGTLSAAVHDRGGGLLYDDVLKITWLQDANYVKNSGYHPTGLMKWKECRTFVANLTYHDPVRQADWNGWRLPRLRPVDGVAFKGVWAVDGSGDEGYNCAGTNSELGYMFHVNLGLKGYYAPDGSVNARYGSTGSGVWDEFADVGLVRNLVNQVYWTETDDANYPKRNAWMFHARWGYQNFYNKWDEHIAWPVRDGDVLEWPRP